MAGNGRVQIVIGCHLLMVLFVGHGDQRIQIGAYPDPRDQRQQPLFQLVQRFLPVVEMAILPRVVSSLEARSIINAALPEEDRVGYLHFIFVLTAAAIAGAAGACARAFAAIGAADTPDALFLGFADIQHNSSDDHCDDSENEKVDRFHRHVTCR